MRPVATAVFALVMLLPLAMPAATEAREKLIWSGQTDGYDVRLSSGNLTLGKVGEPKPFFSGRMRFLHEVGPTKPGEESHEVSWQLLSVVGPIVSFEQAGGGYAKGTAHPYAYRQYEAVDLRKKGRPAVLTDFFPRETILKALLGDKVIQRALVGKARPKTLEGLLKALDGYTSEDCTYGFTDDLLSSFAFHHLEGNQVAVRFGLTHGCEVARGSLTTLGVLMPIPPSLKGALEEARQGREGFLAARAPKDSGYFEVGTFE